MSEREDFEEWARGKYFDLSPVGNRDLYPESTYSDDVTESAWEAWEYRSRLAAADELTRLGQEMGEYES